MKKRKVVIADDEYHIGNLIKALIDWERYGLEIVGIACDGNSALRMCEKNRPDFLITDIRMPGLSGLDLIKQLYESFPEMKMIIITGYSHFSYAHQALRYNVTDYLLKPIQKEELEHALEKGLRELEVNRHSEPKSKIPSLKSMQKIKNNLLLMILQGNMLALKSDNMDWLSKEYHLVFNGKAWRMLCIEFILNSEENSAPVWEFLEEKIRDIVLDWLPNGQLETVSAFKDNNFFFLMGGEMGELLQIDNKVSQIKGKLLLVNDILQKINFTVALSDPVEDFSLVEKCIEECRECIAYKIIKGKNKVIRHEEIPQTEMTVLNFVDDNFRKKFCRAVVEADEDALAAQINDLVALLYRFLKKIDGILVYDVYELLANLFFRGIQVFEAKESGEFTEASLDQQKDCFYNISEAFTYLSDVFRMLLRKSFEESKTKNSKPVRMAQLYIEENYREPLTLEQIAEKAGLNETYLSSIFKKQVGKSVVDFLTNTRIQRAKELLIDRDISINEIAERVGFNDAKYFTKRFKKFTGVSPNDYRKLFS